MVLRGGDSERRLAARTAIAFARVIGAALLLYERLRASPRSELERPHAGTPTLDALPAFELLDCALDDLCIPDVELAGGTTKLG